ncbi:MAG: hypothetical protein ACP6IQ_02285 [Candidatus Njordarchaeia archaeon]
MRARFKRALFYFMAKLVLNEIEVEELLTQIISGKRIFLYNDVPYAVGFPNSKIKDAARIIYLISYKKMIAAGIPTKEQMRLIIQRESLLPSDFYIKKKQIEISIKELQKSKDITGSEIQRKEIDYKIEKQYEKLWKYERHESQLLSHTAEQLAENIRVDYYLAMCTFKGEDLNTLYWKNYEEFKEDNNRHFILRARENFVLLNGGIKPNILRAVARSLEWRNKWEIAKKTGTPLFEGVSTDWDKNKINLCYWSDFYDSILSYSEPPSDDILNDDDKLFEWIQNVNRMNKQKNRSQEPRDGITTQVKTPYKVRTKI